MPPIWAITDGRIGRRSADSAGRTSGAPVGPPKSTAPIGPSRNVSIPIFCGGRGGRVPLQRVHGGRQGRAVAGEPDLAGVEVELVGPREGQLERQDCFWILPPTFIATTNSPWSEYDVKDWYALATCRRARGLADRRAWRRLERLQLLRPERPAASSGRGPSETANARARFRPGRAAAAVFRFDEHEDSFAASGVEAGPATVPLARSPVRRGRRSRS